MEFRKKIATLMILAAIQFPCVSHAAEEDKELALIAAEQEKSEEEEQLNEIKPALTESISTEPTQETNKEIKERKKKLKQTRKEKEKDNERKLAESNKNDTRPKDEAKIIIESEEPEKIEPSIPEVPITPAPSQKIEQSPISKPSISTQPSQTIAMPDQKTIYANFQEVARAVKFIPLYMPRKSGYEITALYAEAGIVEVRYGRRWEPTISLSVKTHKRADGEPLKDISGVSGVKWRVDTSTGTTIYIAKISETRQVAAWAVGHYTFSAQAENLSFAGFHSLVADELVELSTHYYIDL